MNELNRDYARKRDLFLVFYSREYVLLGNYKQIKNI